MYADTRNFNRMKATSTSFRFVTVLCTVVISHISHSIQVHAFVTKSTPCPPSFLVDASVRKRATRSLWLEASSNTSNMDTPTSSETSTTQIKQYQHTLAVLTLPLTSSDRIANDAILTKAISCTLSSKTLSVILRCRDDDRTSNSHSLSALRRYVGEIYSAAWDSSQGELLNVIVYPQNLPNTPPESWLHHRPDLECVVSHDSILGWHSVASGATGLAYTDINGDGKGGLDAHVNAMNADRKQRNLNEVVAIHVDPWPIGASDVVSPKQNKNHIVFMEDEEDASLSSKSRSSIANVFEEEKNDADDDSDDTFLLNGPVLHNKSLFNHVAVGGTFDGMHYGHRKLLTLAVSSLLPPPSPSQLLVGVTSDEMLKEKTLSNLIPPLSERIQKVKDFLNNLAPGIKNQISVIPIEDKWGPPAYDDTIDALVLSDEVLETGVKLNAYRQEQGLKELTLLCTRRTEPNGMSSTTMRKWRENTQKSK